MEGGLWIWAYILKAVYDKLKSKIMTGGALNIQI
jgi:hypothetical protein